MIAGSMRLGPTWRLPAWMSETCAIVNGLLPSLDKLDVENRLVTAWKRRV
jgi:hypothetical protein